MTKNLLEPPSIFLSVSPASSIKTNIIFLKILLYTLIIASGIGDKWTFCLNILPYIAKFIIKGFITQRKDIDTAGGDVEAGFQIIRAIFE